MSLFGGDDRSLQNPFDAYPDLQQAADYLLQNCRIGNTITQYRDPRYVQLQCTEIFNSLVSLYTTIIKSQWQKFKWMFDCFTVPTGSDKCTFAARVYISHWFHDLYCTNQKVTGVISDIAYIEHFPHTRIPYSDTYDNTLVLLNASIRPTHIQNIAADEVYIPKFGDQLNWSGIEEELNPFKIDDFILNHGLFLSMITMMKKSKEWKTSKIVTGTFGRPCWLFDWHENNKVCAWFPKEGNYTDVDLSLAYIVGVACTPNLGLVDIDDWQYPETGVLPATSHLEELERVNDRHFFGAYEVRTIEVQNDYVIPRAITTKMENSFSDFSKKRKKSETESSAEAGTEIAIAPISRFRIMDWGYHAEVIRIIEDETRVQALFIISFN